MVVLRVVVEMFEVKVGIGVDVLGIDVIVGAGDVKDADLGSREGC
jgi:hypothetical protein